METKVFILIGIILVLVFLIGCIPSNNNKAKANLLHPIINLDFSKAQQLALEDQKQLLVLLHEEGEVAGIADSVGFNQKKALEWQKNYISIAIPMEQETGQYLIEKHYVRFFPCVLRFAYDGTFMEVNYGSVIPTARELTPLRVKMTEALYEQFRKGDRESQLVQQLLGHYLALPLEATELPNVYIELVNAFFETKTLNELKSYHGYKALLRYANDIRISIIDTLFKHKKELTLAFEKLKSDHQLKRINSAHWMLVNALRKTYERLSVYPDPSLLKQCEKVRNRIEPGYYDRWIGVSLLRYYLTVDDKLNSAKAALKYFDFYKEWYYSTNPNLLEQSAQVVLETTASQEALKEALRWINRASDKNKTPTRFELHAKILDKLGQPEKATLIRSKATKFTSLFNEFISEFPRVDFPISLDKGPVNKKIYQMIPSLEGKYKVFFQYISREGSLYKKSEKVEPIAFLKETEDQVQFLARVHLVTGSLLPVSHFRSYYIKATFTKKGGFVKSEYLESFIYH